MRTSILRPGLLVSLRTSVKGNVRYSTFELEQDHVTLTGERKARWETERTIRDPEEHERALKARSLARSAVQTVCAHSDFGLLCLVDNRDKLDAAIDKAEAIAREFNLSAEVSRLNVNVIIGEVSPNDARAIRAINQEMRDLMDTMANGLATLDVTKVRDAANKARSVAKMLEPNAGERVAKAIAVARGAAREIVKAGEAGAVEIDQVAIQRIVEARTSFLDLDEVGEVQAPEAAGRVLDLEGEQEVPREYTPEGQAEMFGELDEQEEAEEEGFDPATYDGPLDGLSNDKLNAVIRARGLRS
jgi:hypothetical protein